MVPASRVGAAIDTTKVTFKHGAEDVINIFVIVAILWCVIKQLPMKGVRPLKVRLESSK